MFQLLNTLLSIKYKYHTKCLEFLKDHILTKLKDAKSFFLQIPVCIFLILQQNCSLKLEFNIKKNYRSPDL